MTAETHSQLATFIWSICNLLRGPYKRNEYRKVNPPALYRPSDAPPSGGDGGTPS